MTQSPKYIATLRESFNIGGFAFGNGGRVEGDNIIETLEAIMEESHTISPYRHNSCFAKTSIWSSTGNQLVDREDYSGNTRSITFSMHNGSCIDIRGHWSGKAQSDKHVAPFISLDLTFICVQTATDADMAVLMNYFHDRDYNVSWDGKKPSDILWSSGVLGHGRKATSPDSEVEFKVTPYKRTA
jgi:hypothetical protein